MFNRHVGIGTSKIRKFVEMIINILENSALAVKVFDYFSFRRYGNISDVCLHRISNKLVLWRVVLFHFRAGSGFDFGIRAGSGTQNPPEWLRVSGARKHETRSGGLTCTNFWFKKNQHSISKCWSKARSIQYECEPPTRTHAIWLQEPKGGCPLSLIHS